MSRIAEAFAELKREGKRGLIPFLTAGDPDLETTYHLLVEIARAGATLIELGVPFSDPVADGPTIQRASERALLHNFGIAEILEVVARFREKSEVPVMLFSYFNPLLQFGTERLGQAAHAAGVDGVLVTDLVPEEAVEFSETMKAHDLDTIFLVAPTSTDARLRMVAERASGFIYAVSRAGVTGARTEISSEAERLVSRVRRFSDLPVVVGFGISNAQQVADVWRYADAAVVGSALVSEIEKLGGSPDIAEKVGEFVRSLQPSLRI
ncbi:MAG TPA: tryptophan synthase subunit alpha [Pyrinomonadaceae bacterium]|nr:tryptophan synthase subunit alpha [Pyrinomonadaceae bacterium]